MKLLTITLALLLSTHSFAFTIECLGENNLDVTQYGFEHLKIESVPKGNWITINGKTTKLGESLPVKLNPYAKMTMRAESFTVLSPLVLGSVVFSAGSMLTYTQNRMELQKYRDTVVTFADFGKRIKIDIDCKYTEH